MIELNLICQELEKYFPLNLQEDYDNSGLQIDASENGKVSKALVCLDVTLEVVKQAKEKQCDLIISHHPLIFGGGIKKLIKSNDTNKIVLECVKNNISVYACHTNCDSVLEYGTSQLMAKKFDFESYTCLEGNVGMIGQLKKAIKTEDFFGKLKQKFDLQIIKHTAICKQEIKKIAFCSGSGSSFLKYAIAQGADVYVSADFTYHRFFEAEGKIIIADIGHFESEKQIKEIFCDILLQKFSDLAIEISDINTNPINYFL